MVTSNVVVPQNPSNMETLRSVTPGYYWMLVPNCPGPPAPPTTPPPPPEPSPGEWVVVHKELATDATGKLVDKYTKYQNDEPVSEWWTFPDTVDFYCLPFVGDLVITISVGG